MSCTLRAGGLHFDVDAFLKNSTLVPCAVFRGDNTPKSPNPEDPAQEVSGFNVAVSDAEFTDVKGQTDDAAKFLEAHKEELERLVRYPGVEGVEIDFAAEMNEALVQSYVFSPRLLSLMGGIGIEMCISFYKLSDEDAS